MMEIKVSGPMGMGGGLGTRIPGWNWSIHRSRGNSDDPSIYVGTHCGWEEVKVKPLRRTQLSHSVCKGPCLTQYERIDSRLFDSLPVRSGDI